LVFYVILNNKFILHPIWFAEIEDAYVAQILENHEKFFSDYFTYSCVLHKSNTLSTIIIHCCPPSMISLNFEFSANWLNYFYSLREFQTCTDASAEPLNPIFLYFFGLAWLSDTPWGKVYSDRWRENTWECTCMDLRDNSSLTVLILKLWGPIISTRCDWRA